MKQFFTSLKKHITDIFFPKFCINCNREGDYLCQDCFSLIDISERQYCPFCIQPKVVIDGKTCNYCRNSKRLTGLYSATSYDNFVIKKLINQFKYEPYIKEISKPLSSLIITHLITLSKINSFPDYILIPIPLSKKKLKLRGFNQAEEIGKGLSKNLPCTFSGPVAKDIKITESISEKVQGLKIPIFNNVLIKTKQTPAQVNLRREEREKNIKNVFFCQKPETIQGRKVLLVDDIFTTGSTMEECACVLRDAGAKEVWGMVVARG